MILKKTDGGNLATASQRWLAPNAFHTIIKQPSIYVNGTLTTEQTDTYAYKAYLETILNYGTEDEETILRPQGYYSALNHPPHDLTANQIDSTTPHANYTELSKERKKRSRRTLGNERKNHGRKTIQLFGLPHADLDRMLIPGVDLKMRFTLNDPKFFMNRIGTVATDVRLEAGDLKMKFYACMVKFRSDVYNKIATARLQRNLDVYYTTVRSEIRTYTLQNNHSCRRTKCHACFQFHCRNYELFKHTKKSELPCKNCNRHFYGVTCQLNHLTQKANGKAVAPGEKNVFHSHKKCSICSHVYTSNAEEHMKHCGLQYCPSCEKEVNILQHKCYQQPVTHEQKKNKQRTIFVYFDIEERQDTGNHVANLACAETYQNDTQFTFEDKDCVPDFIQWVHL